MMDICAFWSFKNFVTIQWHYKTKNIIGLLLLKLCSPRVAWGWVNYGIRFLFGWTISLNLCHCLNQKLLKSESHWDDTKIKLIFNRTTQRIWAQNVKYCNQCILDIYAVASVENIDVQTLFAINYNNRDFCENEESSNRRYSPHRDLISSSVSQSGITWRDRKKKTETV